MDVFGADVDLRVVAAFRDDRLVAVFPLEETKEGGTSNLQWLRNPHTPLFEPACRKADLPEVCETLLRWACGRQSEWRSLGLGGIRTASPLHEALVAAVAVTGSPAIESASESSRLVSTTKPLQEFVALRGRGFRNRLRGARSAARKHDIAVKCVVEPEALEAVLGSLASVSRESWQGRAGTGAFAARADRQFYNATTRAASAQGKLRLHVCSVDGQPAGYLLEFVGEQRSLMLKSEYDQQFRSQAIGWHLVTAAYVRGHQEGGRTLDFGTWPTRFKDEWATELEARCEFHIFRRDWRGHATSSALQLVSTIQHCAGLVGPARSPSEQEPARRSKRAG